MFCKIVAKELPADIIYEDANIIAFNDISPQSPVHVLILPKKHIQNVLELTKDETPLISDVFKVAGTLAKKYILDKDGFRIVNNTGNDGGQTVNHIHFHLMGGRKFSWPPG